MGRYDVQMAYAYRTENSIRNYALKTAVEAMELPEPEGQEYHDAYCDAQFTAAIGRALTERYGPLPTVEELQALKNTLPALANEFIVLLKETSVACYVAVNDLTRGGEIIRGATYQQLLPLLAVAIIYLLLVMFFSWLVGKLERRLRSSDH